MASTKDEKREERSTKVEHPSVTSDQRQEEIREAIVDAFEEARDNTDKAVKEARKEIPRYKEVVGSYQEKMLESAKAMADDYIDSQKEIFGLLQQQQSTWISRLGEGNKYGTFWSSWMSRITNRMTETYAHTISSAIDSLYATTRLTNNMVSVNTEAFNASARQVKEFSKISLSNVKTLRQTTVEYMKSLNELAVGGDSSAKMETQTK